MSDLEKMLELKQDDWIEACGEIDELKDKIQSLQQQLDEAKYYKHANENLSRVCDELEKQRDEAVKALEFYADEKSWRDIDGTTVFDFISDTDLERRIGDTVIGGKRAREVLAKLRGKSEN